ncbi:3-dehydroquinate dehydratase [Moraxella cuniculi DSM 21768]|uniref:3-dehydroquinate dehydratase n=1 Tax=Moraxella cuniculi DSM 21768 TaxID=1122245 RepID=A0A1N7EX64_9GAMM|nr:type II 3-dehydroquinate dehydratase [Moraxella cuniculi]OOS02363.1 type II 3-dehydroquinate dehydratase [Moraxella cuniculi]SIR92660.1 3-dehydroquinate dehydratase [Moraxella cuniculi DSM 21768]
MSIATSKKLALINGANLHLLGKREPHLYGTTTLHDIEQRLQAQAAQHAIELIAFQSNHEGAIVDFIGEIGLLAARPVDGIIINPAAFTHSSIAIRDALSALNKPFIEVHLSNVHAREPFRSHSYFSDKAVGVICGLGDIGYDMALQWFIKNL